MKASVSLFRLLVPLLGLARTAFAMEPIPVVEKTLASRDTRGIFLRGSYVLDTFGKAIPALIDFQWAGFRAFDWQEPQLTYRPLLVAFDVSAGFTGGYGGNAYPTFFFFGGNVKAIGEAGYRFDGWKDLTGYLGASALIDASAVAITGTPIDKYDQVNPVDGLAGLNQASAIRINGGFNWLGHKAMPNREQGLEVFSQDVLLVTAFVEESLRRPGRAPSAMFFTSFGVRAQFDMAERFTATFDALWGTAFGHFDSTFGETHTPTHFRITAAVRKHFGPIWLALDGKAAADMDTTTSSTVPNVYVTSTPVYASAGLTIGVSL